MTKYKYYFKKPSSEIIKDIFRWLAISGAVYIAASSPYFITNVIRAFKRAKKYGKKRTYDAFYQLQREGCVRIKEENKQIYISLTDKGRKKAGWLQIDKLKIKKPKRWDGKWRIVIFDIPQSKMIHREALRGKLKHLGFRQLQKSVWTCPFNCKDEIDLLRDFFGFSEKEIRLVVAERIGDDKELRDFFKV